MGIQFGSHSYSHHDLTQLSDYECELDLRESRILLEDLLGTPIRFLAYPRGLQNERVRKAARKAGYSNAFSMMRKPRIMDTHSVPRVGIYSHNGRFTLEVKISSWYVPAKDGNIVYSRHSESGSVGKIGRQWQTTEQRRCGNKVARVGGRRRGRYRAPTSARCALW